MALKEFIAGESVVVTTITKGLSSTNPFASATIYNPTLVQLTIKHRNSGLVVMNQQAMSSISKGKWHKTWQSTATAVPGIYDNHVFINGTPYQGVGENEFVIRKPKVIT